jgi:hypothetical protein
MTLIILIYIILSRRFIFVHGQSISTLNIKMHEFQHKFGIGPWGYYQLTFFYAKQII